MLISLRSSGAEWVPRAWVELATRVLESGVCGALIGTRALLGEGWDCPAVNCLVDLTVATTGVSVQQMRGRSLRLDPGDPQKLASNWDVVCVAPDLTRGSADYERFVRKHLHLYAPADDGEIEAGPSHVHPELAPFAPPPATHFADINRAMLAARRRPRRGPRPLAPRRALPRSRPPNPRGAPALEGSDPLSRRPLQGVCAREWPDSRGQSPRDLAADSAGGGRRRAGGGDRRAMAASARRGWPGSRWRRAGSAGPRCGCGGRAGGCRRCCRSTARRGRWWTPTASWAS